MFRGIDISSSGMAAMKQWLEVSSNNITNMNTTRGDDGEPYHRQTVVLQSKSDFQSRLEQFTGNGVEIGSIIEDNAEKLVYDPEHPDANEEGYVRYGEINLPAEIANIMVAQRSYEANLSAFNANKQMIEKELEIGKY